LRRGRSNPILLWSDPGHPTPGRATVKPPLIEHSFPLDQIEEGCRLFGERREGVLKVAFRPRA